MKTLLVGIILMGISQVAYSKTCVSKYGGGEYFAKNFYRTTCSDGQKFLTDFRQKDMKAAQIEVTEKLKTQGYSLAGVYMHDTMMIHMDAIDTNVNQHCVLITQKAKQVDTLDCDDHAIVSIEKGFAEAYIKKNNLSFVEKLAESVVAGNTNSYHSEDMKIYSQKK